MSKHTPGPWFSRRVGFSTVYIEARIAGGMLQEVAACGPSQEGPERQEANAHLIAAAPELLEALEYLFSVDMEGCLMMDGEDDQIDAIKLAKAAIAKARGEA